MIKIHITEKMKTKARDIAERLVQQNKDLPNFKRTMGQAQGQEDYIGFLGEMVFSIFSGEPMMDPFEIDTYDFLINGKKIDVKSSVHHKFMIVADHQLPNDDVDRYVQISIVGDYGIIWGWMEYEKVLSWKTTPEGEYPCFYAAGKAIPVSKLRPIDEILDE